MSSNTLDELGRAVLETVAAGSDSAPDPGSEAGSAGRAVDLETLEVEHEASRADLEARLAQLVDNALVREVDDGGDGDGGPAYEPTENGLRVLNATPIGVRNHRIDTPADVERAIEGFSLRPDEEAAVRNAFAFLRYWGDATTAEIVDATYSEEPAGRESPDRWWEECVRDRLEALPDVRVDSDGSDDSDGSIDAIPERWSYEGTATVDQPEDADGRDVADPTGAPPPFASVRHALEKLALSEEERRGARVAFAVLFELEAATTEELVDRIGYPAGNDSSDAWADRLADCLAELPNVERGASAGEGARAESKADTDTDTGGEETWTYRP